MNQDYTELFNLVFKLMIEDITNQVNIRLFEEDDIMYVHFSLGRFVRDKYLWCHYEFCKYIMERLHIKSTNPDDIAHSIIQYVYKTIKSQD